MSDGTFCPELCCFAPLPLCRLKEAAFHYRGGSIAEIGDLKHVDRGPLNSMGAEVTQNLVRSVLYVVNGTVLHKGQSLLRLS